MHLIKMKRQNQCQASYYYLGELKIEQDLGKLSHYPFYLDSCPYTSDLKKIKLF